MAHFTLLWWLNDHLLLLQLAFLCHPFSWEVLTNWIGLLE